MYTHRGTRARAHTQTGIYMLHTRVIKREEKERERGGVIASVRERETEKSKLGGREGGRKREREREGGREGGG